MTAWPSPSVTPSCQRVFQRLDAYSAIALNLAPGYLVLAVLAEESLASSSLKESGISLSLAANGGLGKSVADDFNAFLASDVLPAAPHAATDCGAIRRDLARMTKKLDDRRFDSTSESDDQQDVADAELAAEDFTWPTIILDRAQAIARNFEDGDVSTQHLMLGMIEADTPVRTLLRELSLDFENVRSQFGVQSQPPETLQVDFEFDLHVSEEIPGKAVNHGFEHRDRIIALLDANLNRCREGLRVLDDFARFILRSHELTKNIKQLRHRLVSAEKTLMIAVPDLLRCRDVQEDIGTSVTTSGEMQRDSIDDLAAANARRVQESLRSLEEFGKLLSSRFASEIKQIRYTSYSLHQGICSRSVEVGVSTIEQPECRTQRQDRLADAKLYVLLTEALCQRPWKEVVQEALAGGADVIQLREKNLVTTEVIRRGRWISAACREAGALSIVNDIPEAAVQAKADGVHLGQEDMSPSDVRAIVGPSRLIGLSTHDTHQVSEACHCPDVDYLGIGPVFPSGTKSFAEFPGLELVGEAADEATLPWFAIGGIQQSNLAEVGSVGALRVAVCGAIIGDANPWEATAAIRAVLDEDQSADVLKFNRG